MVSGEARSPRSASGGGHVQRRHAQPGNRAIEGVTLPNPIRISSRLGQTSLPGSACGTPRLGTPRMGTPRMSSGGNKGRRKRLLFLVQVLLTLCIGFFVMKQITSIVRQNSLNDDRNTYAGDSPVVQDYFRVSARSGGDTVDGEGWMLGRKGSFPQEIDQADLKALRHRQTEKLKSLADALLAENDNVNIRLFPDMEQLSGIFAHPTSCALGSKTSHFYRFTNIKLSSGAIQVFGGSELKQPKRMWYDVVTGNSTMPKAPTVLLMRGKNADAVDRNSIDVQYIPESLSPSACTAWIEEPAMLVHSRYPDNMWHAWVNGLISTFQTARELGYLSLVRILADGKSLPLGSGLPLPQCPIVADLWTGSVKEAVDCVYRLDSINSEKLSTKCNVNDTWCQPGLWLTTSDKVKAKGPAIIYFDDSVIESEWASLYSAMGSKVRSFDSVQGTCFRNLVVGTTKSLSFEEPVFQSEEPTIRRKIQDLVRDLDEFSEFTRSAQQRLQMNNAIEFLGYVDMVAEKLRKGIHFGQGGSIDKVYPIPPKTAWDTYDPESLDESSQDDRNALIKHPWVFGNRKMHKTPKSALQGVREEAKVQASISPLPLTTRALTNPRPVVTYISRLRTLNRAVLNERQVLRYIYWKYDVTLRVTDLSEHVEAVAEILSETDVLIGMHGPGWVHAVFLKPGAVTLQLMPYGWRRDDGPLLRGDTVKNLVHLRRGTHIDWVNPHSEFSFFRRKDFRIGEFQAHPTEEGEWVRPDFEDTHPAWLYANTYADLNHLGAYIDSAMEIAGIERLSAAKIAEMNALRLQIKQQMPERMRSQWEDGNLAAAGWEENDAEDEEMEDVEDSAADPEEDIDYDDSVPEEEGLTDDDDGVA